MTNILITGNGFDIAHGLETSYPKFINFCESIVSIAKIKEMDSDFILSDEELKEYKKTLKLRELNNNVENKIIDFFNSTTIDKTIKKDLVLKCRDNYWLNFIRNNKDNLGDRWCDLEYII